MAAVEAVPHVADAVVDTAVGEEVEEAEHQLTQRRRSLRRRLSLSQSRNRSSRHRPT